MSLQILKKRIQNTKNTEQVTKVIQMIANAKLKSAENKYQTSKEMKLTLKNEDEIKIKLENRATPLYLIFGSDTGFCGSINSNVKKYIDSIKEEFNLIIFGKKLDNIINFKEKIKKFNLIKINERTHIPSENEDEININEISEEIFKMILNKDSKISSVYCLYFEFKNILTKELKNIEIINLINENHKPYSLIEDYELDKFKLNFKLKINEAFRSNAASIFSSRSTAMSGASKNAEEMSKDLKIKYNKLRQEKINKELLDIVSGSL